MPNIDYRDFTPVKIVQLFYYLSSHTNYMGKHINVDMLKMLKHVLPSALEGETIRHRNLMPIISALSIIKRMTNDYPDFFDMTITGIGFDLWDRDFADRQKPKNRIERQLLAMKQHHLKANENKLMLLYKPTKQKKNQEVT